MTDVEKTLDDLKLLNALCHGTVLDDAIALLKEQEHKDRMFHALEEDWKKLKEQEHEVCENCPYKLEDIGDFSDGYHTFNDLYTQRAVLFATIVNQNLDKAWKSHKHEDGEPCFGGGWFIVAVDTPKGSYSYHYEDKYWDIFKCIELPVAKHWDGHTDKDLWRLLLLT